MYLLCTCTLYPVSVYVTNQTILANKQKKNRIKNKIDCRAFGGKKAFFLIECLAVISAMRDVYICIFV